MLDERKGRLNPSVTLVSAYTIDSLTSRRKSTWVDSTHKTGGKRKTLLPIEVEIRVIIDARGFVAYYGSTVTTMVDWLLGAWSYAMYNHFIYSNNKKDIYQPRLALFKSTALIIGNLYGQKAVQNWKHKTFVVRPLEGQKTTINQYATP